MDGTTTFLSSRKAAALIGVHPNTLRSWEDKGKICAIRTNGGQRLYDVQRFINKCSSTSEDGEFKLICYARVSSKRQEHDLERQVSTLKDIYPDAKFIKDISSSLNYKRRGLCTILEQAMSGERIKLIITHKDRLARFGFELIEFIIKHNKGEIMVLTHNELSPEDELTEDMLSTLHSFSSKLYGLRKYKQIKN